MSTMASDMNHFDLIKLTLFNTSHNIMLLFHSLIIVGMFSLIGLWQSLRQLAVQFSIGPFWNFTIQHSIIGSEDILAMSAYLHYIHKSERNNFKSILLRQLKYCLTYPLPALLWLRTQQQLLLGNVANDVTSAIPTHVLIKHHHTVQDLGTKHTVWVGNRVLRHLV